MERVYVGVVGQLQFDVLESRMKNEYGVEYRQYAQPYTLIRRLPDDVDPSKLYLYEVKWVQDVRGKNYLLFTSEWSLRYTIEHNEGLILEEYGS
jgi:peptide chain release factor 3